MAKRHKSRRDCPAVISKRKRRKMYGAYSPGELHVQWRVFISCMNGTQRAELKRIIKRQRLDAEEIEFRPSAEGKDIPSILRIAGDCKRLPTGELIGGMKVLADFLDYSTNATAELYSEMRRQRDIATGELTDGAAPVYQCSGELSQSARQFGRLNHAQKREESKTPGTINRAPKIAKAQRAELEKLWQTEASIRYLKWRSDLSPLERAEEDKLCAEESTAAAPPLPEFRPQSGAPRQRADCGLSPDWQPAPLTDRQQFVAWCANWENYLRLRGQWLSAELERLRRKSERYVAPVAIPDSVFQQRDLDRLQFVREAIAINRAFNCGIPSARAIVRRMRRTK